MSQVAAPIKREPLLAERMAEQLRREIADGQLKPGSKLPTERVLSEAYGVSRPIVREALGRLKHDGLVTSRQGSGAFVADSPSPSLRFSTISPDNAEEIRNIVELLIPVRVAAAGYAAVRRTAAQMKEIRYWHRSLDEAIRDGPPGSSRISASIARSWTRPEIHCSATCWIFLMRAHVPSSRPPVPTRARMA